MQAKDGVQAKTIKILNAVGTNLQLLGTLGMFFPQLRVVSAISQGFTIIGGVCSVLGADADLLTTGKPDSQSGQAGLFSGGEGIEKKHLNMLKSYAKQHHWKDTLNNVELGHVENSINIFRESIQRRNTAMLTSPVFFAYTSAEVPFFFQFVTKPITVKRSTGEVIIHDKGKVYIMGYDNKAYLCQTRVLRYLLESDECTALVSGDTKPGRNCSVCNAELFEQDFTTVGVTEVTDTNTKKRSFSVMNDVLWDKHSEHSGDDSNCNPKVPCTESI